MMAKSLFKRLMIFVAVYLIVSTIVTFIYREDQDYKTLEETVAYDGKDVDIKVFYNEGEELWAQETLFLSSNSIVKLIEGYGKNSPYGDIHIYSSDLEETDNYPFKLDKDSNSLYLARDYDVNPVVWGVSQMWLMKGFANLPDWVTWGQSAFYAYWALSGSGLVDDANTMYGHFISMSSEYGEDLSLDSYSLPDNAEDDKVLSDYFLSSSFFVYNDIYKLSSIEEMANIHDGVMSSQNYQWDSSRYASFVQDKTEADISSALEPVFSGNVGSSISKWKTIYYIELALTFIVSMVVLLWVFWDKVKMRFKFLLLFKERSYVGRMLLRKYGSKDRIMMELETYFNRYISDDEYEHFANVFYKEKFSKS